jgi:Zn-dependent protease with chaperone function
VALSRQIGIRKVPETYVIQAGGSLNALATRYFRSDFIVLFADLLDACGDNTEARDFIIAHELGHLQAGHLRKRWLLLPGLFTPLLGSAWSRACEYTADRYGASVGRDREAALEGLCILAAGAKQGPKVNRRALVSQRAALNTITMKRVNGSRRIRRSRAGWRCWRRNWTAVSAAEPGRRPGRSGAGFRDRRAVRRRLLVYANAGPRCRRSLRRNR